MANENHSELPLPESSKSSDFIDEVLGSDCPLKRVVAVNEHGMVIESQRNFDVGTMMVLGWHVEVKGSESRLGSTFVSAETIVVESRPLTGGKMTIDDRFHVTFMFSEIDREDRELLVNLSEVECIRLTSGRAACQSGLAIPPPQVFPAVEGGLRKPHLRIDDVDPAAGSACSLN